VSVGAAGGLCCRRYLLFKITNSQLVWLSEEEKNCQFIVSCFAEC